MTQFEKALIAELKGIRKALQKLSPDYVAITPQQDKPKKEDELQCAIDELTELAGQKIYAPLGNRNGGVMMDESTTY